MVKDSPLIILNVSIFVVTTTSRGMQQQVDNKERVGVGMYILKLLEGILSGSCARKRLYCSQDGCWGRSGRSGVSPPVPAELAVGYSSLLLQSAFLSQVPDSISHALEVQLGEIKTNLLS